MFLVFENNKPAKYPHCQVDPSWNNNQFESKHDAVVYVLHWLGSYKPISIDKITDKDLTMFDKPYMYNGFKDFIQIIEI